jgi:hypothetical protein
MLTTPLKRNSKPVGMSEGWMVGMDVRALLDHKDLQEETAEMD